MTTITVDELVTTLGFELDQPSMERAETALKKAGQATAAVVRPATEAIKKQAFSLNSAMGVSTRAIQAAKPPVDKLATSVSGLNRRLRETDAQSKKSGGALSSMFGGLGARLGGMAAAYTAFRASKGGIGLVAEMESVTESYAVMLQSRERAVALVEDIQALASKTPLTTMGISKATQTLIQFGVKGEEAIGIVRQLGDVAGGNQEKLNSLALAFGQMRSAGKLMGQDLLQMINAGFNPLQTMVENAETFGLKANVTMGEVKEAMSKGAISSAAVAKAFELATAKGGMFYKNMEAQSKTLNGLWSTLIDNIQLRTIKSLDGLKPAMKAVLRFAIALVNETEKLAAAAVILGGALLAAFGPALQAKLGMTAISFNSITAAGAKMWAVMNTGATGFMARMGGLIALLGVAYYAYQKINLEAAKREGEERKAGARRNTAIYEQRRNDLQLEKIKLQGLARSNDPFFSGQRGKREQEKYRQQLRKVEDQIKIVDKQLAAAGAAEKDINVQVDTPDAFKRMADEVINNQKNLNLKQDVTINMPVKVDKDGKTPLTAAQLRAITKTEIRSALSINALEILEKS